MLDAGLKTQLKGYLDRLTVPVEIVASLDEGGASREMLELLIARSCRTSRSSSRWARARRPRSARSII